MKNIILGISLSLLGIVCVLAVLTVNGRAQQEKAVRNALKTAVREEVQKTLEYRETEEESSSWKQDVEKSVRKRLKADEKEKQDPNYSLKLVFSAVDPEKGLLSCKAVETFTYPNGKTGEVGEEVTALLEQRKKDLFYTVSFVLPNDDGSIPEKDTMEWKRRLYKNYYLGEGSRIPHPKTPVCPGRTFEGWYQADGTHLSTEDLLKEDQIYYARFR